MKFNKEEKTVSFAVAELRRRYMNLRMKGSYAYTRSEAIMLTAESIVEEFEVVDTRVMDDNRELLDHPILIGTDRYGRNLELPLDRVLAIEFLDTDEQARLRTLQENSKYWINLDEEWTKELDVKLLDSLIESEEKARKELEELIAKGVKVYERKGLEE